LSLPSTTGTSLCGSDGSTVKQYLFHTGSVVTTGISGSDYTLRFTMPTVYDGLTYDPNCSIQGNVLSVVNTINTQSTGTTNNYLTEIGLYNLQKELMILSKLQYPVLRQGLQQFLVKYDF
jgi:hypothetical protein